jgi:hypothetical protein
VQLPDRWCAHTPSQKFATHRTDYKGARRTGAPVSTLLRALIAATLKVVIVCFARIYFRTIERCQRGIFPPIDDALPRDFTQVKKPNCCLHIF